MTTKQRFYFRSMAIGGSGENPDPAVYCPANGYIIDPEILQPPIPLPETTPESITFICNAEVAHWRCLTNGFLFTKSGSDLYQYELYNDNAVLIDSWTTSANAINFDFPTTAGYYTVKVSLPSPSYFIQLKYSSTIIHESCIEAVILNCTNLGSFSFRGNSNIQKVDFKLGSVNTLTYLQNAFEQCSSLNYFKVRFADIVNLIGMDNCFYGSALYAIDLSELNAPNLNNATNLFRDAKHLTDVIMPETWHANNSSWMFMNTVRLRSVTLPKIWTPSGTPSNSLAFFFYYSAVGGEVEFPSMPYITTLQAMFQNAVNIEVIRFKGDWSGLTGSSFSSFLTGTTSLRIFEAPRILTFIVGVIIFATSQTALRYYIGPDIGFINLPVNSGLISITGEHDTTAFTTKPTIVVSFNFRATLTEFQCPKLKVAKFVIGTSATIKFTSLHSLEIDWANSDWSSTSSPQLQIAAAIDATEINRILTALPTVTGKTADLRYCDGYATCNPAIATAKGWTWL